MLMPVAPVRGLPAGLAEAGDVATHRRLAQLDATEAELAVHTAGATGDGATLALAGSRGIAGHGLQFAQRLLAFRVRLFRTTDGFLDLRPLCSVLAYELFAALLALDHAGLRHVPVLTCGTGS